MEVVSVLWWETELGGGGHLGAGGQQGGRWVLAAPAEDVWGARGWDLGAECDAELACPK